MSVSVNGINEHYNPLSKNLCTGLTSILCSDWFSLLLSQYLNLKDIVKFDCAVCNRNKRPEWLESLAKFSLLLSLEVFDSISWSDALVDWIILRNLHLGELAIVHGYSKITNDGMCRLALQCTNIRKLKLFNNIQLEDDKRFQYLAVTCFNIEEIELIEQFPFSFEDFVWLDSCEQLKSISIESGRDKLLSAENIKTLLRNRNKLKYLGTSKICPSELLLELGKNRPLFEHLLIVCLVDIQAMHIEVFTQSCTKLKILQICGFDEVPFDLTFLLFDCLGKNCSLLERLQLNYSHPATTDISEAALKSLAQGCSLLDSFDICNVRMSAQGVKHLVGHCLMLYDIS